MGQFHDILQYYVYYGYYSKNVTGTYTGIPTADKPATADVLYGVSIYVIFKVSDLKTKVNINTPYDISAAGQLHLANANLEVRTFGLTPTTQNLFVPNNMGSMDINSKDYLDSVLKNIKSLSDNNTIPQPIPVIDDIAN